MKFEELDDSQRDVFKKTYYDKSIKWDDRIRILMELTQKSARTVQKWAKKLGLKEKSEVESPEFIKAKERKINPKKKRFIITWAQNDTPVHRKFLSNLEEYAKFIKADIHVIAGRYKNPTSVFTDRSYDRWHSRVTPYLDAARHDVHKYLSIMSDVKIQPTAVNPMTGLEGMSGINSCVFGSPKVQLDMIPVLEGCKPKMMVTTGACTVKNYTDSKAGKKGEFHHTLGFVVVEIKDEETFFIRQVTATDDGDFIDLMNSVQFIGTEEEIQFDTTIDRVNWNAENFGDDPVTVLGETKIEKIDEIEACVLGDIHFGKEDPVVLEQTLDLLGHLRPKHVVLHDVFDGDSINHHESKDPFAQYRKEVRGKNSLKGEIEYMLDQLERFSQFENVVIVRSNHDDFLDRWLKNGDWKKQPTPKNSMEYMEYSQMLLRQYAESEDVKGVIPEIINGRFPEFVTLGRSDSYIVKGWELAQHGDVGASGSRGSVQQFRRLNAKMIVGHYHAPSRKDGVVAVGTSTYLRVGYNIGASSWLQSHAIILPNGKVQHIHFIDGEFTTFKFN